MRILGIDYGTRGVGVAISDEGTQFAFPLLVLPNDEQLISALAMIGEEKKVKEYVVGDTRAEGGAANRITEQLETFVTELKARTGFPVHLQREAWSSLEASRFAPKGKERDDSAAAAIILQRFLDAPRKNS